MTDAHVLFFPTTAGDGYRWLRVTDGGISARGEGLPADSDDRSIVIVPAEDVTLHWAALPDRSAAQSVAAARSLIGDSSLAPLADLHVAVGREPDSDERPIGVVSLAKMHGWLATLKQAGVDPLAIIPAPMILPRPESGYVSADLGSGSVIRGVASGFSDEAGLTELVTAGSTPVALTRELIEAAILAAVEQPLLDLRQGSFVRQREIVIDWRRLRRIGWLILALVGLSLVFSLVQIGRYGWAAGTAERRIETLARGGLAPGESVNDAPRQLTARLARLRGNGYGFSQTAAIVFSAIRAVPGSEVRALSFDADGKLRIKLITQTEGQVNDVKKQIEASGMIVVASTFNQGGGRITGEFTVGAP